MRVGLIKPPGDQPSEGLVEGLAAQVEPEDISFGVDEVRRGDRDHAEGVDQVDRARRVMQLGPRKLADLGEIDGGRFAVVETDADDFEAGIVISAVGGLEARQLGNARRAPGGPEINEDVLAAVGRQADRFSRDVFRIKRRRRFSDLVERLSSDWIFWRRLGLSLKCASSVV